MTKLEKLNALLMDPKIKVPEHVRQVHASGRNQQWLRKNLGRNKDVDPEIIQLLNLPMSELAKP
jgi:hypothetical protein